MTRNQRILSGIACGLAALSFGCSEKNPTAPNLVPAFIDIVSGQQQSDTVGKELPQPIVARVRNSDDQPIAGQIVNFRVVKGGGSVFAGAAITNAEGLAQERWTLGTSVADSQIVEARAVDPSSGAPLVFARFFATPVAGAPDSLEKISGDGQSAVAGAALPESLVVRVADSYGNPVSGASVSWTPTAGTGTLSPASAATTANGHASTKWTLGAEVGAQSARVVVGTVPAAAFTANSLSPSSLLATKSAGDNQTAAPGTAVAVRPAVRVTDANGNPLSGITVTFAVTQGGGSVTGGTVSTDVTGTASVGSWVLGSQVGTNALSASVANGPAVSFTATAAQSSADITVSIVNPSPGLVGDTVHVSVNVTSRLQVASVGVAVAGRTAALSNPTPGVWTGTVLLNGTPRDTMTLVATARDVNGSLAQALVALTHDVPPRVTLTSPINNSAADGTVMIDASCADDDPNGCTVSAELRPDNSSEVRYAGPSLSPLHAPVSLAGWEGQKVRVVAYATDSKGQRTCCASDTVWVESSHLHFIGAAEGTVLDASDSRLLWLTQSLASVGIRDVNTGVSDTVRGPPYGSVVEYAVLTPTGAVFASDALYVWQNGSLTRKTIPNFALAASGNYVIYQTPSLYRFDVTTGADILVASDDGNTENDVATNGDVAYWNNSYEIVRYRNGVKDTVAGSNGNLPGYNSYPLTDGINIVFRHTASLPATNNELWLFDGSSSSLSMLSPAGARDVQPHSNYAVNGGWTAFTKDDASGNSQVWTRSPAGVLRAVSPEGTPSVFQAIGPDGTVIFNSNGDRYAAGPTSPPVRISAGSPAPGTTGAGPVFWRNGTFVVVVENGAFTLTP